MCGRGDKDIFTSWRVEYQNIMTDLIGHNFKNNKKLVTFVTGGDPDFETGNAIIKTMIQESNWYNWVSMPFSDPNWWTYNTIVKQQSNK